MPVTEKRDESDFEFKIEELPEDTQRGMMVKEGRVLDRPVRCRSVPIGKGQTKSVVICIHGKLTTHPCATCEYEAPRVSGRL